MPGNAKHQGGGTPLSPPENIYGKTSALLFVVLWTVVGHVMAYGLVYVDAEAQLSSFFRSFGLRNLDAAVFPQRLALAVAVLSAEILLVHWASIKVNHARMRFGVAWPAMYAPTGHKHEVQFNCFQRAHQFLLEYRGQFYVALLVPTLGPFPFLAFVLGSVYVLGRVVFCLGYHTGNPKNKELGDFSYFGLHALVGLSHRTAYMWLLG
jgi:glutathione S-transferase